MGREPVDQGIVEDDRDGVHRLPEIREAVDPEPGVDREPGVDPKPGVDRGVVREPGVVDNEEQRATILEVNLQPRCCCCCCGA